MPETTREAFERRSRPMLARLLTLPRPVLFGLTLVLLAVGVLAPGVVGAIAFLVLAAFAGWLAALSWPVARPSARALRLAGVLVLVLLAVADVTIGLG